MNEKIEVKIINGTEINSVYMQENESLLGALVRNGFFVQAPCGGNGICGKCKVQVLGQNVPIGSSDKKFFKEEELEKGWRLACMLYPTEKMTISLGYNDESEYEVVHEHGKSQMAGQMVSDSKVKEYNLAIDLGTTTLVFEISDKNSGETLHSVSLVNSQRKYGADVISRIQASVEGKKNELQTVIRQDLLLGIKKLEAECHINADMIKSIAISGNTTMVHLLKGYDCTYLGVYPFSPVNIDMICEPVTQILGYDLNVIRRRDCEAVIMPGISAFVGGDIVSGMYAHGFSENDDICLLIDLGTNGEMALGNKDKILVTSTAAGPAFEGGNIAWGMGSVAGAICSVAIDDGDVVIKTIRDENPRGICGTGVVEVTAELVKNGIVDETGLLDDDYFDNGFFLAKTKDGKDITFSQKDIREIQLAKAAIRAGIETLLLRYGITAGQVAKVYLAGGFGYQLDVKKAVLIGLLPETLSDRIEAVGNSSLAGAVKYLQNRDNSDLKKIVSVSKEVTLANDADFNAFYMGAMMFTKK